MTAHHYPVKPFGIRLLHWAVVALISAALITGYTAFNFNWTADGFFSRDLLFIIHRSAGLSVAVLCLIWFVLRLPILWHNRRVSRWRWIIGMGHIAFAFLAFTIVILAWVGRAIGGHGGEFFSALPLYNLVSKGEGTLPYVLLGWHKTLIPWLIGLIVLHVFATLVHSLWLRDNLLASIIKGRLGPTKTPGNQS